MRSLCGRNNSNMMYFFIRREKPHMKTETCRKKHRWWQRQMLEWGNVKSREVKDPWHYWNLGRHKQEYPEFERSMMLMLSSQTSSIHTYEKMHFCCFKLHTWFCYSIHRKIMHCIMEHTHRKKWSIDTYHNMG
jgi:hypothetical protein